MSLQLAAQHLSNHGRGRDSMLVHMSPREVKGLNDLAMAHGGQLSINPSTGLPEAGFLESILPMVAGAALVASGVGAPMAALMVGGGTAVMTGSLQKGLMAGLGAYGGANLGAGLSASGMEAAVAGDSAAQVAQAEIAKNASVANSNFFDPTGALRPEMHGQYVTAQGAAADAGVKAISNLAPKTFMDKLGMMGKGIGTLGQEGGFSNLYQNLGGSPMSLLKTIGPAVAPLAGELMKPEKQEETKGDSDMGQRYGFSMNPTGGQPQVQPGQDPISNTPTPTTTPFPTPDIYGKEQRYFSPRYSKITPEEAKKLYGYAEGGIADEDRPTETPALQAFKQMQAQRAEQPVAQVIDANAQFNQYAQQTVGAPNQLQAPTMPAPTSTNLSDSGFSYDPIKQQYNQITGSAPTDSADPATNPFSIENRPVIGYSSTGEKMYGEVPKRIGMGGYAAGGGISHLGDYSDGGRLLRGPGDGVSDSIPAMIGKRQPARLADGEFVVPARIVSELGNGSTEAGARKLYAMMDRIQKARGKTVGKNKVAKNSRSEKYLPA